MVVEAVAAPLPPAHVPGGGRQRGDITGGRRHGVRRQDGARRQDRAAAAPPAAANAGGATPSASSSPASSAAAAGSPAAGGGGDTAVAEASDGASGEPPDLLAAKPLLESHIELCEQSIVHVFCFLVGHDTRATSATLRSRLDNVRPVVVLGPPPLPASACYREPIGQARAGYGVWVPAHKIVQLTTNLRQRQKASQPTPIWDLTQTTAEVSYARSPAGKGSVDTATACGFWKATMRQLHATAGAGRTFPVSARARAGSQGTSLRVSLNGQEWHIEDVDADLLKWLQAVENF